MVVDDSAVVRGLIVRMLESDPALHVVASVGNGQLAVSNLQRTDVDVVVLDIEMPVMDGLTALPKLLQIDPSIKVIMASTLTLRNAEISIRALQAGAADYVPKPSSARDLSAGDEFKRDLTDKVKTLGNIRRHQRPAARAGLQRPAPAPMARPATPKPSAMPHGPVTLRQPGRSKPDILAIGSSTGGPQALFALLKDLHAGQLKLPIVITQHMPPTFTTILADHINRMTGWPCKEAQEGDVITAGQIFLAPGDFHMLVETKGVQKVIRLNKEAPENFCRPAVDPMFRSVSKAYGDRVLAVILTGMGSDGARGGKVVVDSGGTVVAQDEGSSVVWGMPGAAAMSGICSAVLPLRELGSYITKFASRGL
ncbi:MAG: chemotaxis response regulator protein-glutamate methylesterase [Magnetospirillum sp. WYHS-4]